MQNKPVREYDIYELMEWLSYIYVPERMCEGNILSHYKEGVLVPLIERLDYRRKEEALAGKKALSIKGLENYLSCYNKRNHNYWFEWKNRNIPVLCKDGKQVKRSAIKTKNIQRLTRRREKEDWKRIMLLAEELGIYDSIEIHTIVDLMLLADVEDSAGNKGKYLIASYPAVQRNIFHKLNKCKRFLTLRYYDDFYDDIGLQSRCQQFLLHPLCYRYNNDRLQPVPISRLLDCKVRVVKQAACLEALLSNDSL